LPAWEIKGMGGVIPLIDPRLTGDNLAEEAVNCDLTSGHLHGLFAPVQVQDFTATPGPVERAYLFPGPVASDGSTNPIWIPFPSRHTSVVRSPLANDDLYRLYWTSPGQVPAWNTYARFVAGQPPYSLGTIHPTAALTITGTTGGDTTVPQITRAYVYTWTNQYGEESAPSPPSNNFDGPPDAVWHISGFPTTAPGNPSGFNYAPITGLVLYRTVTGQDTGTQYFEVTRFTYPPGPPSTYDDGIHDEDITGHLILQTAGWNNPPSNLDGLIGFPGGMMMGFTNNTIHFCEPDHPHSWPSLYDQSVHYNVIALAVWQQFLMVLTTGYPSTGSGSSPSNFVLVQSQVPEPCVSRGSVVVDLLAVYYASQNGLIQISGYGMTNQTLQLVDKERWQERYGAANIFACRHRSQYLAVNGTDTAFVLDYADPRLGFQDLSTFKDVVCIWNDEYHGETYLCANKKIYHWDDTSRPRLRYRWRSKRFFAPVPISLGAVQVTLGPEVNHTHTGQFSEPPLSNGDPSLAIPDGAWGVLRYYAGPDFQLIMEHAFLYKQQDIFRLPAGFRAFDHQIEIVSMASVYSVQLSTTMTELRGV
jgi:hypothetical protein